MSYLKSKFMTTVYLLSNIVLYVLLIGYFESIKFTLGIVFIGVLSFIVYYVADIFAVEGASKSKNLIYSTIINALLAVLMIFKTSRIDGFTFYLCMYIYQISVKSFIIKFAVKKKNILIIGDNYKNEIIRSILKKHNKLFRIIGTISANEGRCDRDDCLGTTEQLKEIVRNKKIDLIINLEENIKNKSFINQLLDLKVGGVQVYDYLSFYEIIEEKIPIKSINEEWFLFGYGFNILHNSYQQKEKRIFDVIISSVIIILTFPIMLIAALIVKLESKGSVLFIQERIGKGNIPFNIYKFRSMRSDAEKDGPQWAKKNDTRVTKFGNFMRKTRIDELPQLFNIIKGDMSFIGPRPERQHFINDLKKEIPFFELRHAIRPGLSGWAQVNYSYGASVEDAFEKLQFDLYYMKHYSMILDIVIIFKTIKTVIFGRGR